MSATARVSALLLAGAALLAAPALLPAQVVVDDFATAQATLSDPPGGASTATTAGADILGLHRGLRVFNLGGPGPTSVGVAAGALTLTIAETTPDSRGEALLVWDGDLDPSSVDPTGLGGVDLTAAATQGGFRFGFDAARAGSWFVLTVYQDATHVSRAARALPAGISFFDVFVDFAELGAAPGAVGPASLTQVGAMTLRVGGVEGATPALVLSRVATAPPTLAALKVDRTPAGDPIPGSVQPGDQIRYRITISNSGAGADGVALTDVLDANLALVAGSVRTTPLARDDLYRTVTSTPLDSSAAGAPPLLANDSDPDGNALAAVPATGQATTQGGTVNVLANGHFLYTPAAGFQGVDSFPYTIAATAGDPTTDAAGNPIPPAVGRATVVIDRVAPVVTAGGTLAYDEDDPPTAIDPSITVADADSANLVSATAQVTGNYQNGEDLLSFVDTATITGVFVPATGLLTLTGSDTVAAYQAALRAVRYENGSDDPDTGDRTVTWIVSDGVESSAPVTSTIEVDSINDAPVLTAGGVLAYTENQAATAIDATITVADADHANLASASAQITGNYQNGQDLLACGAPCAGLSPTFVPATGTLTLSGSATLAVYQTALRGVTYFNNSENPSGLARTVTWLASDGIDTSAPVTSTIAVTPVNDPPIAADDAWDTIGNTQLVVDLPALATPHVRDTTPGAADGVRDNDTDPAEGNNHAVTAIVGCADVTPPFGDGPVCATTAGGTVVMNAVGTFTYTPPAGHAGASDSFQYTLTDDGTPAPASDDATVTISRFERVWYVDPTAGGGGTGTSGSPFDTLDPLDGGADSDQPMDYLFVHDGTLALSIPLPMESNQHLIGEGAGLSIPVNLNGNGSPTVLVPAGTRPQLTNASGDAITVGTEIPIEIVGLSLASTTGNVFDLTSAAPLTGSATLTFGGNEIRGAGAEGLDVNLNAGTTGTLALRIENNAWNTAGTHTGNGVDVTRAAGTLSLNLSGNTNIFSGATAVSINGGAAASTTITGFSGNSVHQNTGGSGILVSNATFDGAAGAPYTTVSGGSTVIGTPGNGVGANGLVLTGVAGDLAFTDLDAFADGGAAVRVTGTGAVNTGAGTGTRVTVGAGVAIFEATGGPAVDLSNLTADLQLSSLRSTNSTTTGVSLANVADGSSSAVFSAGSGSTITNAAGASGPAFNVSGGNAGISYAGTISNNSGAARAVSVTTWAGDDATDDLVLSGAIDENGAGILLNANGGSRAIRFSGGLDIDTTTGEGFAAISNANTGGLHITGINDITSTSATALRVTSTTIGNTHLTFRNISAGNNTAAADPVNGIVLNGTGALGSLIVTGTGSASSGGTIQFTTDAGISLTSTLQPQFAWMNIQNTGRSGIDGQQVTGFTLENTVINNVGTAAAGQYDESNIAFNDNGAFTSIALSGTVSITNNTLNNARRHGIQIENGNGTISNLTISNNILTSSTSAASSLGTAILVLQQGSAATASHLTTGTISGNTITNFPSGEGIAILGGIGNSTNNTSATLGASGTPISITTNAIAGQPAAASHLGSNAIRASINSQVGVMNFNISGNGTLAAPITNIQGQGISVFAGGTITGTTTIDANVIVANQTLAAGTQGLAVQVDDGPAGLGISAADYNVIITNNNVSAYEGNGIRAIARASLGKLDATIQNNTVGTPILANRNGIRIDSGSAAGDVTLCLLMTGNSSDGSGVNAGMGIRKQGIVPSVNDFGIVGLVPSPTTGANAAAKVNADNPAGGGTDVINGENFVSCTITP